MRVESPTSSYQQPLGLAEKKKVAKNADSGPGSDIASDASTRPHAAKHGDDVTTLQDMRQLMSEFVREREWEKFHSPKNLSMSLAIEAAELMEHFQWLTIEESKSIPSDSKKLEEVGEELADVLCYAFAMANSLGLDIADVVQRKMIKNRAKYPADRFKGKFE